MTASAIAPATLSNQNPPAQPLFGRPARDLSAAERDRFLGVIRAGGGRVRACRESDVSYKTFLRLLRQDEDFAAELWAAETELTEACEAVIYKVAMDEKNPALAFRASVAFLQRKDKQAERAAKERAEAKEREVARKETEVERAAALLDRMDREQESLAVSATPTPSKRPKNPPSPYVKRR